jgi:hypothetical protein
MEGRCRCGAISFSAPAESKWVAHCHCSDCRKASGAPFTTYAGYDKADVVFAGAQPVTYRSSPRAARHFCGACGSPIAYEPFTRCRHGR